MRSRNGAIDITTERFPIVDIIYAGPATPIEDFRDAFEEYARIAERKVRVAWLIDMRNFDPLKVSATNRKDAARVFDEFAARLAPVSVAEARVIVSPLTRGILTAFDWLTGTNKWPCRQYGTMEAAETWLRAELLHAGTVGR